MFYTVKHSLGSDWTQRTPMCTSCVQDIENISCEFEVFPVVPNKLWKVMKYETKNIMSIIFLETLNIEWGQIDPKGNRRVTWSILWAFYWNVLFLGSPLVPLQRYALNSLSPLVWCYEYSVMTCTSSFTDTWWRAHLKVISTSLL